MPPDDILEPQESGGTPAPAEPTGAAVLTLPPDAVRNSPEYRALQTQLREEARARGRAEAQAAEVRQTAETARQAAEAQREQVIAAEIESVLGQDGVAAWNSIVELYDTDPVAAAQRFKDLQASAQSAAAAAQTPPSEGGTQVPAQSAGATPPPPGSNVSTDNPLGSATTGVNWDEIATDHDKEYADVVARNQDPVTRARVTDRERGRGFMAWLASSYIRGGARPREKRPSS